MSVHSTRDRSRSPIRSSNAETTSNQIESTNNGKNKKDSESQQRMRNLKSYIQTLINESTSLGSNYDEQAKTLEKACIDEYQDIPSDRIRRLIRNLLKTQKSSSSSFLHQNHSSIPNERFDSSKKTHSNSIPITPSSKPSDLVQSPTSNMSAFDADFLRHAFSQQFRPSLDLSAYFSAAAAAASANGNNSSTSLFRPNFSPSSFLQSLTNTTPLAPPSLVSSHAHTNGTHDSSMSKSSKQNKLSTPEMSSIRVLVNAYREAASYLSRSADELEQLI